MFAPSQVNLWGMGPRFWNSVERRIMICFTAIKGWGAVVCERLLTVSLRLLVGSYQISLRDDTGLISPDLCQEVPLRRPTEIGNYAVER
jgi:hypothetical protein